MRALPFFLLLLLIAGCGSSKPTFEPESEPESEPELLPADTTTPPPLKTLQGEDAPWAKVRADGKRTLLVFSTFW
jgi:hypothetical protein